MDGVVKASGGPSSGGSLDEHGHFFDFTPIYRESKFCDRVIRLEILKDPVMPGVSENKDPGSTVDGVSEAPERSKEGERVADPLDSYRNNVATTQPTTNVPETKPQRSENGAVTGKKRPRDESESEASPSGTPEKAGAEKDRGGVGAASRRSARLAQSMDETPGKRVNRGAENGAEDCLEKEKILGTTPEERPGPGECAADEEADEEGAENRGEVEDETEAEEIPVSSMVIAAKSLVLRRMMLSEMKEAQRDAPIILKVTQEEKRAVKELLSFICNGELSETLLDPKTCIAKLIAMLEVGDKFGVCSFMGAIIAALRQRLENKDNPDIEAIAFDIPEHLQTWDEVRTLAVDAQDALSETFRAVTTWRSDAFRNLGERTVAFLLQSDDLRCGSEVDVMRGVHNWVCDFVEIEEQQAVMSRLIQHVRLGCIRGELLEYLSGLPEMRSDMTRELLQKAMVFQSYSEPKKLAVLSDFSTVRSGFLKGSFEIAFDAVIDGEAKSTKSKLVTWDGRQWHVKVLRASSKAPATVGLYLYRSILTVEGGHEPQTHKLRVEVFAKNWPANYWESLAVSTFTYKEMDKNRGWVNVFGCPWHEVTGEPYVSRGTKEVNLKVVVNQEEV